MCEKNKLINFLEKGSYCSNIIDIDGCFIVALMLNCATGQQDRDGTLRKLLRQ